jgi:hypothetical protein
LGLGSGEELGAGEVAEGLVGADGIAGMLPGPEFSAQGSRGEFGGGDLRELLGVFALGAFDVPLSLGECGDKTKSSRPRSWQAASNWAANSPPPSTCTSKLKEVLTRLSQCAPTAH